MQALERGYGRLLEVFAAAACALILGMTLMICADVFLRNVRIVPGMVGLAWANEISEAMLKDPIVEAPSDLVLVGRVMGLLSGVGKQLGSEVNLLETLAPYLLSQKQNPDRATP